VPALYDKLVSAYMSGGLGKLRVSISVLLVVSTTLVAWISEILVGGIGAHRTPDWPEQSVCGGPDTWSM